MWVDNALISFPCWSILGLIGNQRCILGHLPKRSSPLCIKLKVRNQWISLVAYDASYIAQNWFWLTVCLFALQKATLGAKASHLINDLQMNSIIHSRMSLSKKKRRTRRWGMWDRSWIGTHANYFVFLLISEACKGKPHCFFIIYI